PREVGTARLLQDNGQVVPGGPGVRVGRAEDPFPSGERTLELLSGVIEPTDRGIAAAEIVTGVQSPGPLEAEDLLERLQRGLELRRGLVLISCGVVGTGEVVPRHQCPGMSLAERLPPLPSALAEQRERLLVSAGRAQGTREPVPLVSVVRMLGTETFRSFGT